MAKILVVDDDKDILRLLEFTLKRVGHQVLTAIDGPTGLAEVEAQRPDLIVADVMMPKMTGYEFCRRVRALQESKDTPIIVFSARFQPIDKQTALEAGATDYLPKSSSPDVLIEAITEHLPETSTPVVHKTIGFFSLRGGTGVTSLAVNTAVALVNTQKARTTLLDLTPFGGHAALMLGVRPTSNIANALAATKNEDTLDSIKPHLLEHRSGIQLLASTLSYKQQLSIEDNRLQKLVETLKSNFSFTLFDLPHNLHPDLGSILTLLDKIALVLSPDMPSLQSTAMALQGMTQLGIEQNRIALVLNQIAPQNALPLETIQKALKRPIAINIPFAPDMVRAINSSKPILLSNPNSASATAITQLAKKLST